MLHLATFKTATLVLHITLCQEGGRFESRSKTSTIRPIVVKIVPTVASEIVLVWWMSCPKACTTHCSSQLGLADKDRTIKGLIVWFLVSIIYVSIPSVFVWKEVKDYLSLSTSLGCAFDTQIDIVTDFWIAKKMF